MAKKTFVDAINPAMQFITPTDAEDAAPAAEVQTPKAKSAAAPSGKKPRGKAKPSGSTNKVKTTDAPEGYKANPAFVETKSRRLQLLMQPSLHDRIKARAAAEGLSVNEFVHKTLENALGGN